MRLDLASLLNEPQLDAVRASEGPLLILAGAGSGKTRVITYRIANLLLQGVPQSEILAVTFTNKAAKEMSQRVRAVMGKKLPRLTVCTFHAFGVRVLREHGHLLGYRPNFTIYDAQDQAIRLKEAARDLGLKPDAMDFQKTAAYFSGIKTGRLRWRSSDKDIKPLYREYQKDLKLSNATDFDDLIVLPVKILTEFQDVRRAYHERYSYILVDEFQDTSTGQYELMRLLAEGRRNICVVGDDDQSIYSWRGASFANIVRFEQDFPGRVIMLEQNYRSTKTILRAANALISHNRNRKPKALWSGLPDGEPIGLCYPGNEMEEAEYIVDTLRTVRIRDGLTFSDIAVLVRANHLTRAIEEVFRKERIPYRISGGMSFFERQEVRDILAYLRLIANHDDNASFTRVINTPRRGLGRKLLEKTMTRAGEEGISLFSALSAAVAETGDETAALDAKTKGLAGEFLSLIAEFRERFLAGKKMADAARALVEEIDYWGYLVSENKDKELASWKFRNVESLINSIADYEEDPEEADPNLFDYIRRCSLAGREDEEDGEKQGGEINLMTIHAAKGLEFPVVFIAGVEDGIIPNARSVEESEDDEEERRLFYVALTRAEKRLFLSACSSRRKMGKPAQAIPSPFLEEIPDDCLRVSDDAETVTPEEKARLFEEARRKLFKE